MENIKEDQEGWKRGKLKNDNGVGGTQTSKSEGWSQKAHNSLVM